MLPPLQMIQWQPGTASLKAPGNDAVCAPFLFIEETNSQFVFASSLNRAILAFAVWQPRLAHFCALFPSWHICPLLFTITFLRIIFQCSHFGTLVFAIAFRRSTFALAGQLSAFSVTLVLFFCPRSLRLTFGACSSALYFCARFCTRWFFHSPSDLYFLRYYFIALLFVVLRWARFWCSTFYVHELIFQVLNSLSLEFGLDSFRLHFAL